MWWCYAKIAYYIVLIVYHLCDIAFDWYTFSVEYSNGTFSGIPTNIDIEVFFGISCGVGTFCSIAMIVVYGYYIAFHCDCIQNPSVAYHAFGDGKVSLSGAVCRYKKCDRRFVLAELWISVLELLGKDDIQSSLLFYVSQSILSRPSWQSIALSICSIVAHLKLLICFLTKLCGFGSGEGGGNNCSCAKVFACVIGLMGSIVFLSLTIVYLVKAFTNQARTMRELRF